LLAKACHRVDHAVPNRTPIKNGGFCAREEKRFYTFRKIPAT